MAQQPVKGQRFRVVGHGYTLFSYNGSPIYFAQTIAESAPAMVSEGGGAGYAWIQPLDARRPIDIAFGRAVGPGTLTLTLYEEWDKLVYRQFTGFRSGAINDISDVLERSANQGPVTCMKLVLPPAPHKRRITVYHNAYVVGANEDENITIATLVAAKTVTIAYSHRTVKGG